MFITYLTTITQGLNKKKPRSRSPLEHGNHKTKSYFTFVSFKNEPQIYKVSFSLFTVEYRANLSSGNRKPSERIQLVISSKHSLLYDMIRYFRLIKCSLTALYLYQRMYLHRVLLFESLRRSRKHTLL